MKSNFFIKIFVVFSFLFSLPLWAQEMAGPEIVEEETVKQETAGEEETITLLEEESNNANNNTITVDFKDADIRNVLRVISYKGGVNIIASDDVKGTVTTRLVDVPWETALDVILKTYGFSYEKKNNIIRVTTIEKLRSEKQELKQLDEAAKEEMGVINKVFNLKYVDANDLKPVLEKQLSPQGNITVFQKTTRAGWEMIGLGGGTEAITREGAKSEEKSMTLIISDIQPVVDKLTKLIEELDVLPKQLLIEALIVEINAADESKLGIKWNTTATLIGSQIPTTFPFNKREGTRGRFSPTIKPSSRGIASGSTFPTPTATNPFATAGYEEFFPYLESAATGASLAEAFSIGSLSFAAMQSVLEAMATDVRTNVLSNPKIMTLNNHDANILVGERYPILTSEVTDAGTLRESVDEYVPIGIQLLVLPQIWEGDRINMIIHPAVTSIGGTVPSSTAFTAPRITTREIDTQVVVRNGDTIVLGGLVKDQKVDRITKVPLLGDIPLLGLLFRHKETTIAKIELLIFVTPRIVEDKTMLAAYEKEKLEEVSKKKLPSKKWESRKKK